MKNQKEDIFEPAIPIVPKGWDVLPFEQAADVASDKSKRVKQRDYLPSGKLAVIDQGQDFIGGYTDEEDLAFEGELPVILFGDHTRSIKYVDRPFAVGADGVKILKPAVGFDPKYFYYLLRSLQIPSRGYSRHFQFLRKFHLPRAPKDQQKHIVAEIEKQFSRLDEAVANLKRVKANLKRYKAAVLKAAVEGRLVETEADLARREGRNYESAFDLVGRVVVPPRPNRYSTRTDDVIPGHAALSVGNPGTPLPEGWCWSPLVDIARMESGHTPSRSHPEWWGGLIPWIGIADAREAHGGVIHDTEQHTNDDGLANSAARLLPAGTVCVSRTASVGYVVVMGQSMATSQDFVNWIPTEAVTSEWLRVVFTVDRDALIRFGKGSVHKTIYFPEWLSAHVAVPPLAEQHRIVAEVDRRLSLIRETEAQVDANLKRAERLRQSILGDAFSGALLQAAA